MYLTTDGDLGAILEIGRAWAEESCGADPWETRDTAFKAAYDNRGIPIGAAEVTA